MINRINLTLGSSTIKEFVDLRLSQPFDSHHLLDIHLGTGQVNEVLGKSADSQASLKELTQKWVGEKVTATIMQGTSDASGNLRQETEQTFIGIVTGVQLQMTDAVDSSVIISGMSPTMLLNTGANTRSFSERSLTDIVNEVLNPFKGLLKSHVSPIYSETIPYITQFEEDDYHFLQRLAETFGEWFYYDGDEVLFGKSARNKTDIATLEYGSNLSRLEYEVKLVPMVFQGVSYDYVEDESYTASSKDETVNVQDYAQAALSKSDAVFSYENIDLSFHNQQSEKTLKRAVNYRRSESSNRLAVLKGTSTSLNVRVGSPVKIKDDILENGKLLRTDDYGSFIVTSIHHYVDSRGFYQNSFEAIPRDVDYPPVDYRVFSPKAETQPAKVVDTADPETMGRVQVRFYWQKANEQTPWIRVANLMSGDSQGVYFVPEVDEVVFVDFEFGNPDLPFVRGSMYHGNVRPGSGLFHQENNIKGIITKGGNHIIIDDSSGKEQIHIYNKDSKNEVILSLDGEPRIGVKSEGKIQLEAKEIELKADKISMTADQEWIVDTQRGTIQSQSTMKVEAQSDMKLSSQSNLNLKGEMGVKMEGTSVDIEGKAQTSVKGNAQLALEGGAQASLKGALVMIN